MVAFLSSVNRSRSFCLLLYTETDSYDIDDVLCKIKLRCKDAGFYAYIKHNFCLDDDGHLKKEHIHFVAYFKNACTVSALSKVLGIDDRFIEVCSSISSAVRYLIHLDDPDKHQYSSIDICTSDVDRVCGYLGQYKPTECEKVRLILSQIENGSGLGTVIHFCLDNNCWSEFRRAYPIWRDLIFNKYR